MNQIQKSFSCLLSLLVAAPLAAASCPSATANTCGIPHFGFRSTQYNVAREMVGWEHVINRCNNECRYGAAAVTFEYDQTFKSGCLAQCLFGADAKPASLNCDRLDCEVPSSASITISGSQVTNRGPNDWLADYFGLPTDFRSVITFQPIIRNFTADISFYFGFDSCVDGLYFRLDLPITHTRWDLRNCEQVIDPGVNPYVGGYYGDATISRSSLRQNATSFFNGDILSLRNVTDPDVTVQPLEWSKWRSSTCPWGAIKTRLAAAIGVFGWNFICCDDHHFGLNIRVAAPTGNRPCDEYFFNPIVGNGHHWELGLGLSGHRELWCNDCHSATVYIEGNLTHLFNDTQIRTFDLCGKPNSRYALAQRLEPATNDLGGSETPGDNPPDITLSNYQFANEFAPVANLTHTRVNSSVAIQGDIAIKLEFTNDCGYTWDIGYEFWGRTCEKFCRKQCVVPSPLEDADQAWALKGDSQVFGFIGGAAVALAATQSNSNIHGGCNDIDIPSINTNPGIDNPLFALSGGTAILNFDETDQTRTSIQPVLLTKDDVDLRGTAALSNKFFTHFNYAWQNCECAAPFLGFGASVEFSGNTCGKCDSNCNTSCSSSSTSNCNSSCDKGSCQRCGINQWGVWIKGGLVFN